MVDHGQTMVWSLPNYGWPWLLTIKNRGKTMDNHGLSIGLTPRLSLVNAVIYGILNPQFKKAFEKLFRYCCYYARIVTVMKYPRNNENVITPTLWLSKMTDTYLVSQHKRIPSPSKKVDEAVNTYQNSKLCVWVKEASIHCILKCFKVLL